MSWTHVQFVIFCIPIYTLDIPAVNATVDCDGAHIKWSIPKHLQGYQINNYTLYINDLNMTFETCNNSIDIVLNGSVFSFNQQPYTGTIRASICGQLSHIYDFTLRTSISGILVCISCNIDTLHILLSLAKLSIVPL